MNFYDFGASSQKKKSVKKNKNKKNPWTWAYGAPITFK
jgi:hypothetical protein